MVVDLVCRVNVAVGVPDLCALKYSFSFFRAFIAQQKK